MPQILRSTLISNRPIAADGPVQVDLPVNPLSAIIVTIRALNDDAAPADYAPAGNLINMITAASVRYRGASIIDGSLFDLAVMYACLSRWLTRQGNAAPTNNGVRSVSVPLCFGRKPYDPKECFPATRRGDLVLNLACDVAGFGLDNLELQVETIELLDATPERFLKVTTTPRAMQSGDANSVDLPIGNKLLGVLLRADQPPSGATRDTSIARLALEVDNVETGYSSTNWESLAGELYRKMGAPWPHGTHTHLENQDVAYTANVTTGINEENDSFIDEYAFLDLDPLCDDTYALDTADAAKVSLEIESTNDDSNPSRFLPVELVMIGSGAAGG